MLFHTYEFLIFFAIVYAVFYFLRKYTMWYNVWLLAASYYFYGSWNWWYLTLIVYSTFLDYFCVNMMDEEYKYPRKMNWSLFGAYLAVAGIADMFAYFFFTEKFHELFEGFGASAAAAFGLSGTVWPVAIVMTAGLAVFFAATYTFHFILPPVYRAFILVTGIGERKLWLWVSIVNNLGLLGFFKYAGFFAENLNQLFTYCGWDYRMPGPEVMFTGSWKFMLPVGISFFTFQSMSYTIDFYRGQIKREDSFIRFASFVSLFPQLVAGPIERAKHLLWQLNKTPEITRVHITEGLSMFIVGLFKKLVMADFLAEYVNKVYAVPEAYTSGDLCLATFAFGWQIYCDFSGYTDMARGVARMMGFNLMLNFKNPYLATGLGDFWGRWHISLSTWFKDYVYIPLGGSRGGKWRTYFNMVVTMVVSGFWHGAGWCFLIWGALHAFGRVFTRELELTAFYDKKVPKIVKQLFIFVFVMYTWVWFRCGSIPDVDTVEYSWLITKRIFMTPWGAPESPWFTLLLCLGVWIYEYLHESRLNRVVNNGAVKIAGVIFMLILIVLFSSGENEQFIYFQF